MLIYMIHFEAYSRPKFAKEASMCGVVDEFEIGEAKRLDNWDRQRAT